MLHWLLGGYFFILPFQFALSPLPGIDLPLMRTGSLILVLLWLSFGLFRRRIDLPRSPIALFLVSFLALSLFSFFVAENQSWFVRKSLFLLSFLPFFFVIAAGTVKPQEKVSLAKAFVSGAALSAGIGILQFLSQFVFSVETVFSFWTRSALPIFLGRSFGEVVATYPSLLVNIGGETVLRASSLFPDPHMAAFYSGMAFPIALALSFLVQGKKEKKWLLAASAFLLAADLLTFSRGGYVGLFGAGLIGAGIFFGRKVSAKKLITGSMVILLLGVLFVASPVGERFLSSFSPSDGSNSERLRLWQEGLGHLSEQPFFGYGLGNYPLIVKPSAAYREPIYAHNLYLDIALETGLAGLVFFLLFLFGSLSIAWRKWKKSVDIFSLGIFFSLLVFSFHAFFETPLFSVHILPILLLLTALAV